MHVCHGQALAFIIMVMTIPVMKRKRNCLTNQEHQRAEDLSPIIFIDSLSLVSFSSTSSWGRERKGGKGRGVSKERGWQWRKEKEEEGRRRNSSSAQRNIHK